MSKDLTTFFALNINYCHGFREELETLTSSTPTNNHYHGLKVGLETLTPSAPINNYCHGLRKGLEILTSSTPTNNHCCNLKESLETPLMSTTFTLFVSDSNIANIISSSIELPKTVYTLWCGYCQYFRMKSLTPATCNLY